MSLGPLLGRRELGGHPASEDLCFGPPSFGWKRTSTWLKVPSGWPPLPLAPPAVLLSALGAGSSSRSVKSPPAPALRSSLTARPDLPWASVSVGPAGRLALLGLRPPWKPWRRLPFLPGVVAPAALFLGVRAESLGARWDLFFP